MGTYVLLLVLAVGVVWHIYQRWDNPYRYEMLYQCVEDGPDSPLYLRRTRYYEWGGGMEFEFFKRVTCVPGTRYTSATSDWFQPWDGYSGKVLCHFKPVDAAEEKRLLAKQLPITRAVAKGLRQGRKSGVLKAHEGFCVQGVV